MIRDYVFTTSADIKNGAKARAAANAKAKANTEAKTKVTATAKAKTSDGQQSGLHSNDKVEHHGLIIVHNEGHQKSVKWF